MALASASPEPDAHVTAYRPSHFRNSVGPLLGPRPIFTSTLSLSSMSPVTGHLLRSQPHHLHARHYTLTLHTSSIHPSIHPHRIAALAAPGATDQAEAPNLYLAHAAETLPTPH